MEDFLRRIELLLKTMVDMMEARVKEKAADRWIDAATTKLMLGKQDKTLYNYVQRGWLICKKVGGANVYLESSVLKCLDGTSPWM